MYMLTSFSSRPIAPRDKKYLDRDAAEMLLISTSPTAMGLFSSATYLILGRDRLGPRHGEMLRDLPADIARRLMKGTRYDGSLLQYRHRRHVASAYDRSDACQRLQHAMFHLP